MERRYLTVVIAILVVSLIAALVWNAVLDIGNRGQIKDTIRETFDFVKANRAQEFVDKTKLACSMIYQDYDEKQYPRKIQDATDLYATLRGMTELVSVDLVKVLERLTCLAAVTFKGADGNEITRYMLLLKYEDREGNKSWASAVPHD